MRIRLYRSAAELEPLGTLLSGAYVWPAQGGDGSGNDGVGDESDEDEEDEEDEEDADDAGGDGGKGDDSGDTGKGELDSLKEKLAKQKRRMQAADRRASQAEQELAKLREKDMPELEKLQKEHADLQAAHQKATDDLATARLENAVLRDTQFAWNDPEDVVEMARRALRKGDLEIDEDGEVEGVADWLKELAGKKPHYVKAADKSRRRRTDDDDDEPPTGSGVGSGKKKKTQELSDEALRTKFPALRV